MGKTVNSRIKMLRTHLGLTQQDFSKLVGLTNTHLSRIENEENSPQISTVDQISDRTGVDKDWLLHGLGELKIIKIKEQENINNNPYKDYAIKRLEKEADDWKKKYEDVIDRLFKMIDRGNLGKFKASFFATGRKNRSVKGAHA